MYRILLIAILVLSGTAALAAEQDPAEADAQETALDWLALIDAGSYEESWDHTAPLFQQQLNAGQWTQTLNKVRGALGKVQTRELVSTQALASLPGIPGIPDGHYVVITLHTGFENKKSAIETVTLAHNGSTWQALGYFIR